MQCHTDTTRTWREHAQETQSCGHRVHCPARTGGAEAEDRKTDAHAEAHEQRDDLEKELACVSLRMRGQQLPVNDREEEVAVEHTKLALLHVRR